MFERPLYRRLIALGLVGSTALGNIVIAQVPGFAQSNSPVRQPVDPGVPIGCLLSPNCGRKLFVYPDGMHVQERPIDPGQAAPCLLDPQCSGQLDVPEGRQALFKRAVTIDDVTRQGAEVGDYIPFRERPAFAPHALVLESTRVYNVSRCTTSIIGADESSREVQELRGGDSGSRRAKLEVVVNAYATAIEACTNLR